MKHFYPITHACNRTPAHTQMNVWVCNCLVSERFQLGGVSERFNNRRSIGSCHKILLRSSKRISSCLLPFPFHYCAERYALILPVCKGHSQSFYSYNHFYLFFFVKSLFVFIRLFIYGSISNASDHEFIRQKYTVSPELSGMKGLPTRKMPIHIRRIRIIA